MKKLAYSEGCLFTLLIVSFVVQKLLILIRSHLFSFCFCFQYSGRWIIENPAVIYVGECLPIFSSRSFIVSGCTFRYLVHFEFIFLYDVRTEKALAANSSTLAWRIPWMEEPGRLPSMGSHRVGHD